MRRADRQEAPHLERLVTGLDQPSREQAALTGSDDVDRAVTILLKVSAGISDLVVHVAEDV